MIEKIKDHRRRTKQKRLDKINMMKGKKVIVDDEEDIDLDDEGASVVDAPQKWESCRWVSFDVIHFGPLDNYDLLDVRCITRFVIL